MSSSTFPKLSVRPPKSRPIRVLHVLGGLDQGGIETWLMQILRNTDRQEVAMDFLIHVDHDCAYAEEVRQLGGQIFVCHSPDRPWDYARNFHRIIQQQRNQEKYTYDIVHSHVHHFSGFVLYLAKWCGIPSRIAHSHNDTRTVEHQRSWLRQGYLNLSKFCIDRYATLGLACSDEAGQDLFDVAWKTDPRWQMLYYGISIPTHDHGVQNLSLKRQLGIPDNAWIVGHVGRFAEQKNHIFLLEITALLAKRDPHMRLLLIGQGELQSEIAQRAEAMGLSQQIMMVGTRSDILQVMGAVMDIFLFPSHHEGLGIVLLEAQAMGLPCIISDVIPEIVDVIPEMIQRLSLSQSAEAWADAVWAWRKHKQTVDRDRPLTCMKTSPFNLDISRQRLFDFYVAQVGIDRNTDSIPTQTTTVTPWRGHHEI